jgi:hypothetical protein
MDDRHLLSDVQSAPIAAAPHAMRAAGITLSCFGDSGIGKHDSPTRTFTFTDYKQTASDALKEWFE